MLCITVTRYTRTQRCSRGIQMNWSASRVRVMSWSLGHSGAVIVCSHNKFSLLWGEAQLCVPYDCL